MSLLFGELTAQAFDQDLLIDGIEIQEQDQSDQPKNGIVELEVEECFHSWMRSGEGKRDDGKGEQEHHKNGVSPNPPITVLDPPKFLGQVMIARLKRGWKRARLGVSHKVEVKVRNSLLTLR